MRHMLLILFALIASTSVASADSPRLKYSTLLGNYWYDGADFITSCAIVADVDSDGNFYILAHQADPPNPTWPVYDSNQVCRLLRINQDGSGVDLVLDLPDCGILSVECHSSGYIYVGYTSMDEGGHILKKITPDGEGVGKIVMPLHWHCHYIDPEGNVYIAGNVSWYDADLIPVTENAMFPSFIGGEWDSDIFLMKYDASFNLAYCSFLGGSDNDLPGAIIGNADDDILLSCTDLSPDCQYLPGDRYSTAAMLVFEPSLRETVRTLRLPSVSYEMRGRDTTYDPYTGSIYDMYGGVIRFSSVGEFQWLSAIDGSEPYVRYHKIADTVPDRCIYETSGIALDDTGNIHYTLNADDDIFPVTADALQPDNAGAQDVTVTRITPDGEWVYTTYFGGSGDDLCATRATAFRNGVFYCAGITNSDDFPTTQGAYLNQRMNTKSAFDLFAFAIDFNDYTVDVADESAVIPEALILDPPHPNPFNPATTITFTLRESGFARLAVYDISGQLVRELAAETFPAGRHEIVWDGRDTAGAMAGSGIYIARLAAGDRTAVRKVTLVR